MVTVNTIRNYPGSGNEKCESYRGNGDGREPQYDFFANLFDTANCESLPVDEMDQYLNSNILTYWQNKEEIWPELSQCAKILSVPATSTSSERVFCSSHWQGEPSMIDEAR